MEGNDNVVDKKIPFFFYGISQFQCSCHDKIFSDMTKMREWHENKGVSTMNKLEELEKRIEELEQSEGRQDVKIHNLMNKMGLEKPFSIVQMSRQNGKKISRMTELLQRLNPTVKCIDCDKEFELFKYDPEDNTFEIELDENHTCSDIRNHWKDSVCRNGNDNHVCTAGREPECFPEWFEKRGIDLRKVV